ncbi:MAG TPA: S1/P1 nuclease [Bryobacteraceae bacterium]|nr:S1/P1 nuclease [Bryobacteraceae bacterium]
MCAPAFPWGCEAHRTIAMIALAELSPNARSMSSRLLENATGNAGLHRFCAPSGLVPFADMSTWADDIREKRRETAPWHYIDIPLGTARNMMYEACPSATGCITSVIRGQLDVLRSSVASNAQKTEALLFVIHLIGDLHQPLHAATNNDRGGNCLPVTFFDQKPAESRSGENFHPNLHAVWDTDLVERIAKSRGPAAFADALSLEFAAESDEWKKQRINLDDWAWESHELAVDPAYSALPRKVPVEAPRPVASCADDNHIGERMSQLHEKIDSRYLREVSPAIRRQLARAGTRLAMVLNEIWP